MYDKLTEANKAVDSVEEIEKGIDTIEHVEKFNPFHDSLGRFSSSKGMKSYSANPKTKAGAMAIERSTKAGYGGVMNVHRESKGENIYQNDTWIKGGKAASPSARARAQANNPQSPAAAAARARTNRVKGTMGATKEGQALHPQRPKKPAQQQNNQQNQQQNQKQNQQAQQNQQQTAANTVRVKQSMKSGVTMDTDFDTRKVAGAKNKEFRGTAKGKDLTKDFDATKMTATDSYRGQDRFTDKVADMQGFNSPPKVVSKQEFDKLSLRCNDVMFRTWGPGNIDGQDTNGRGFMKAFNSNNDMKMNGPSGRAFGDGYYVSSAQTISRYRGNGNRPIHDRVKDMAKQESRYYGDRKSTTRMTWLEKPNLISQGDLDTEWQMLSYRDKKRFGGHMNTYACAKGYDAVITNNRSEGYMVIFNRSKLAVCNE